MVSVPLIAPVPTGPGHPVRIAAPFFVEPRTNPSEGGGALLLRYQDPEFIPRFLTDLAAGRLADPAAAAWWREDRFSPHDDRLVLRLPIHRTFYLVVCELGCDRLGAPALDPARIASAGFVIRRPGGPSTAALPEPAAGRFGALFAKQPRDRDLAVKGQALALAADTREQQWTLEEGEPLGWSAVAGGARDPDLDRRICSNGVGRRQPRPPAYSGEETHPLHPVTARDAKGRLHTLLYGFLPLGGQSLAAGSPFEAADEAVAVAAEHARLPWPFGYRGRDTRKWRSDDSVQVDGGVPTPAFFALLEVLVNRYHLGEPGAPGSESDPLNADLIEQARGLWFRDHRLDLGGIGFNGDVVGGLGGGFDGDGPKGTGIAGGIGIGSGGFALVALGVARFSLYDYLAACFAAGDTNPLTPWLAEQRRDTDAAGGIDSAPALDPLPAHPADGAGTLTLDLTLDEADAEEWRLLVGQRLVDQARRTGSEIPIPKFRQGPDDLFQVVPFVRARDDDGRERLTWAGASARSVPFRVAAPFDPDASRPALIQMPGLRDLKRGLAKGAAMLVPPDTQGLLDTLKLNEGVGPDLAEKPPANAAGLGIQWICSFSIPVVTLVAMILLMIIVTLLNIVFFWLPWVRICLPFPKIK